MRTLTLATLALLLLASFPLGASQGAVDVAVSSAEITPSPVVGATSIIHAVITSDGGAVTTVSFTYADGEGVEAPGSAGGSSFTVVKVLSGSGDHDVSLSFVPAPSRAGAQDIVVRAATSGDANATNDVLTLHTFVKAPSLNVTMLEPSRLRALNNTTVPLAFVVKNLGNAEDAPGVMVDQNATWDVSLLAPLPLIPPGGSITGYLLARPRVDDVNATLNGTLFVSSGTRPLVTANATLPRIVPNATEVDTPRALRLDAPRAFQVPLEGDRLVPITIANTGETDEAFTLNATPGVGFTAKLEVPADWPANLSQPAQVNGTLHLALARGASVTLALRAGLANASAPSAGWAKVDLMADNAPQLAARRYPITASANVTLVPATAALGIAAMPWPSPIYAGDVVPLAFNVTNAGLLPGGNVSVDLVVRDNLRSVKSDTLALGPLDAGASAPAVFSLDTSALAGAYSVTATLRGNASEITTPAASGLVSVRTAELALDAPLSVHAVPGEVLRLRDVAGGLWAQNLGRDAEHVHAWLEGDVAWVNATWELDLAPGETAPLALDLAIPAAVDRTEITLTLHAALTNRSSAPQSVTTLLVLDDRDAPRITFAAPPPGEIGRETTLEARAEDAVGVASVVLLVTEPSGRTRAIPMHSTTAPAYAANYTPSEAGNYSLQVRADDNAQPAHEAQTENLTWTIAGARFTGFLPSGWPGNGSVNHATLALVEATPGSVRSATLDLGSGAFPLATPFAVTLPQEEGTYVVHVVSRSFRGETADQTWTVRLVMHAPRLANLSAENLGDGRVRMQGDTEANVTLVARFETANGAVDYPITPDARGHVDTIVTPPPGWRAIHGLAADDAGNQASGAFVLASPTRVPSPPWMALVGSALAIALLRRRRAR